MEKFYGKSKNKDLTDEMKYETVDGYEWKYWKRNGYTCNIFLDGLPEYEGDDEIFWEIHIIIERGIEN